MEPLQTLMIERSVEKIADICKLHGIADLYAFGSRGGEITALVRGRPAVSVHSTSDVDIGVLPPIGHSRQILSESVPG